MKAVGALFAFVHLLFVSGPLLAQELGGIYDSAYGTVRTVTTESWVEEWDASQGRWVRVAENAADQTADSQSLPTVVTTIVNGQVVNEAALAEARSATRYARPVLRSPAPQMLAQYGPFRVASPTHAAMVGSTDSRSPHDFDAMLRDYPGIATLEMIEAPGTSNDIANLAVGRKIRAAGIATHVPRGGSVRSGAVELFLAGISRSIEEGAQFAVHSWLDNYGREADDFDADHPAHRLYLDYYTEMGMSEDRARAFYAMTNSVPHASARWLVAEEMRQWIAPLRAAEPRIASRRLAAAVSPLPGPIALCTICVRADQSLASTAEYVLAQTFDRYAFDVAGPVIRYNDVSRINVARLNASMLDASLLDSGLAFP